MKLVSLPKKEQEFDLSKYSSLIKTVAKIEYRKISLTYIIDYSEVLSIATQAVYALSEYPEFNKYNSSYLSTAIKWAIRNEVRRRSRWYFEKSNFLQNDQGKYNTQNATYSSILSIDETVDDDATMSIQVKDERCTPDEYVELNELRLLLEKALVTLPPREKALIEAKFYKGKKLAELSDEFGITASRCSRVIQAALAKLKTEIQRKNWN